MISSAVTGLLTGLALIVAIGAQNAYVLRQGLIRQHVWPIVAICAISDLLLILAGVAGIGTIVERAPLAIDVVRWLGVAFLTWASRPGSAVGTVAAPASQTRSAPETRRLGAVIGTALALTWLNPHVYLDTVLLLGSIAAHEGPTGKWWFAAGASLGSLVWFAGLGYGARLLSLDGLIAVVMATIAMGLLLGG